MEILTMAPPAPVRNRLQARSVLPQILPKIQPSPATEMSLAAGKTGPAELPLLTRETGGLTPTVVNSNNSELIPTFTLIEKVEKCNSSGPAMLA